MNYLKSSLTYSLSNDLSKITVTIATNHRRMLAITQISAGSMITINFTNVLNPPSYRQTPNSFSYEVYTSSGYLIERKNSGFQVANNLPGLLSHSTTDVHPFDFTFNAFTDYIVSFVPKNYEMNMYILITVPSQVSFPTS